MNPKLCLLLSRFIKKNPMDYSNNLAKMSSSINIDSLIEGPCERSPYAHSLFRKGNRLVLRGGEHVMRPLQEESKEETIDRNMPTGVNTKWTRLNPIPDSNFGTPCSRSSHGLSVLHNGSRLILHGGEHIARTPLEASQATWAADLKDGVWSWRLINSSAPVPPERLAHAQAVYNDSVIYMFGGRAGITMQERAMNDLWCLDCSGEPGSEKWTLVTPDLENGDAPPEERSFHKMICVGSNLYVFGGCSAHHGRLADVHKFNILTRTWTNLGASKFLRGRGGANLMTFSSEKLLGVVAGFCGEESNDGHLLDIMSNKWLENDLTLELKGLRPRSVCVSASFPSIKTAVIFGGEVDPSDKGHEGAGGFENDLVILDEATATYLNSISESGNWPEKRGWSDGASFENENGDGTMFIFGGLTGDDANPTRLDDLWRLDISRRD